MKKIFIYLPLLFVAGCSRQTGYPPFPYNNNNNGSITYQPNIYDGHDNNYQPPNYSINQTSAYPPPIYNNRPHQSPPIYNNRPHQSPPIYNNRPPKSPPNDSNRPPPPSQQSKDRNK